MENHFVSIFGALKKAVFSGAREINKEYGSNRNFLNAVCASAALVANADGRSTTRSG
jgi:tellurite resistance protein TerB